MSTVESNHKYLKYSKSGANSQVAVLLTRELLRFYTGHDLSKSKWDKYANIRVGEKELRFRGIEKFLSSTGTFEYSRFGLSEPCTPWLDLDVSFALSNYTGLAMSLNEGSPGNLPIAVKLDREGRAWTTLQREFQRRIIRQQKNLVESSHNILETEYLLDVRSFICDCLSLIDITLHQIYIKAEFAPNPGWSFDRKRLESACPRIGGRLKDKLKWVSIIAGKATDFSPDEIRAFDEVRQLRNHFMHWDPPNLCYTSDDLCRWLNNFSKLGAIIYKIRRAIGGTPTVPIIEMMLTPNVVVNRHPNENHLERPALAPGVGYSSCIWPPTVQQAKKLQ